MSQSSQPVTLSQQWRAMSSGNGSSVGAASSSTATSSNALSAAKKCPLTKLFSASSSTWASADVKAYLARYPKQQQWPNARKNLDFYQNRIESKPHGDTIDGIQANWKGNYHLLELHHGYIQWLFPIRENGLNSQSQVLYLHEIEALRSDPAFPPRLMRSYDLMLDFYGMRLVDQTTGAIARGDNWEARYRHLNGSTHNYLRITRILKCLGELGFEHLKLGFLLHIVRELSLKALNHSSVGKSARDYWFPILRNPSDRHTLQSVIDELKQEELHSDGPVRLSEERIREVLAEAKRAREAPAMDSTGSVGASNGSSSSTHATGSSAASVGSQSSDSDDSPRAAAEAMTPARTSATLDDRTEAAGLKRKASSEEEPAPHKKLASPTSEDALKQ